MRVEVPSCSAVAGHSSFGCISYGGEIGSTGVVKTRSRLRQKKLNGMLKASNDNVPYSAMKIAA